METGFIDLHIHSTCSDGTFTPSELVHEAIRHSICAFALTDHDCIDGIKEAQEETLRLNSPDAPEVIAGVELSCELDDREIHMVGLYINPDDKVFNNKLNAFRSSRTDRNRLMVDKLQQEAHLAIDYDSLIREFPDAVITRAHIARYLVNHGLAKDMNTVFSKYIGDDCPYYVDRPKISPQEGISLIHHAGGLAILAHPVLYRMNADRLDTLVQTLVEESHLDGIEAVYSTYQLGDEQNIKKLAQKYHLLISGGSDFHGTNLIFPWETEQDICRFLIIFYRILKMRCIADSLLLMYTKRDCHFTISVKQQSLFIDTLYFLSFTSSNAFRKIRSNSFSEHFFRLDSSEYPLFCCLSCS